MKSSGRNSPCPSCGRSKDGDCRWNDEVIFCHAGSTCGPDPSLRIGDTIDVDGQPWALVKTQAGYDGAAHVFKPHQDRHRSSPSISREELLSKRAKRSIAAVAIERFFTAFLNAWNVPDFHTLTPDELNDAITKIEGAHTIGLELSRSIQSIWREHHDLRDLHRDRFNAYIRNIKYQLNDLNHFRTHYLGEVV